MRLASLGYAALNAAGVTTVARRLRSAGVILCYHNVIPDRDAGLWSGLGLHMPFATFARQMRWLAATYDVIPLSQFVDRVTSGTSRRGTAAITFDDAYLGVFQQAWPLLRDLGLPATVFVVADAPDRDADFWWDHPDVMRAYSAGQARHWLTTLHGDGDLILKSLGRNVNGPQRPPRACRPAPWEIIQDAARSGLGLGVHSATHRALSALNEIELRHEVIASRDKIARRAGVTPPDFFAYPYGLWSDRVRDVVRSAGYRAAFALQTARGGRPDPWTLPRLNVPAGIEDHAFHAWAAGLHP